MTQTTRMLQSLRHAALIAILAIGTMLPAFATVLPVGGGVNPQATNFTITPALSAPIIAIQTLPFDTSDAFGHHLKGTLVNWVIREPGGTLTFFYLITNSTASTSTSSASNMFINALDTAKFVDLTRIGNTSFFTRTVFTTDVGFLDSPAGAAPFFAVRTSARPDIVSLIWTNGLRLRPGFQSRIIFIRTSASLFDRSGQSVIGSVNAPDLNVSASLHSTPLATYQPKYNPSIVIPKPF